MEEEKQKAVRRLLVVLAPGATIYGFTTKKTATRTKIRLFAVEDGRILEITGYAARALGMKRDVDGSTTVRNVGYTALLWIKEEIERALGYKLGSLESEVL